MRNLFLLLFLVLIGCKTQQSTNNLSLFEGQELPQNKRISSIALGSCNKVNKPQPLWPVIAKQSPDLWLWLGDIIYSDTQNANVLANNYLKQKEKSAYKLFRQQVPITGIWDDHDYAMNDGDKTNPIKQESRDLLFDFLDVPRDSEARKREGAYQSYLFGPQGERVKLLLLDARYFRDELQKNPSGKSRYLVSETGDMLGEEQWNWLANELAKNEAEVHIIASGVQILSAQHPYEKWADFPKAYNRLMELLVTHQPNRTILVSGDRHISEVSRKEIEGLPYALHDFTVSGMTHAYDGFTSEQNDLRVGEVVHQKNFGLIKIEWEKEVQIKLLVKGEQGQTLLSQDVVF